MISIKTVNLLFSKHDFKESIINKVYNDSDYQDFPFCKLWNKQ